MADMVRAETLVTTMDRDAAFQAEMQAAPTVGAKRAVLDGHGFGDVSAEDMRAYVESKGGTLVVPQAGHELSEDELAAVAGGLTDQEATIIGVYGGLAVLGSAAAAA